MSWELFAQFPCIEANVLLCTEIEGNVNESYFRTEWTEVDYVVKAPLKNAPSSSSSSLPLPSVAAAAGASFASLIADPNEETGREIKEVLSQRFIVKLLVKLRALVDEHFIARGAKLPCAFCNERIATPQDCFSVAVLFYGAHSPQHARNEFDGGLCFALRAVSHCGGDMCTLFTRNFAKRLREMDIEICHKKVAVLAQTVKTFFYKVDYCLQCCAVGHLLTCGKCRAAHYCSTECQHAHWKAHKSMCKRVLFVGGGGGDDS